MMGSRGWARYTAGAVLLGTIAAALAVASGGRAGSGPAPNSDFDLFAQPAFLTAGEEGLAWGRFKAAGGSGSATHVLISITVPSGVTVIASDTSSDCTDTDGDMTYICEVGTVNAGQTVNRFIAFTASALGDYTFSGFVTWDKGNVGGPGGGSLNRLPATGSLTTQITVVVSGSPNRAGNCTGDLATPPVSSSNPVSTEITGGTPLPSLDLPCPWGYGGENPPSGQSLSEVSFFAFPETTAGSPVVWVMSVFNSPVPFKNLKVFFDEDYKGLLGDTFDGEELVPNGCGPGGTLPEGVPACLMKLEKVGGGARATILAKGTGEDPGSGWG